MFRELENKYLVKIIKLHTGQFMIRRWTIMGYVYLDRDLDYWWTWEYARRWATFSTLEKARAARKFYYDAYYEVIE